MKASLPLFVLLGTAAASAQEIQVSGQAGWGGRLVGGDWTPVTVDVDNRGTQDQDVVVLLVWGFAGASQSVAKPALSNLAGRTGLATHVPVAMAAGTRKRFSLALVAPDREGLSLWAYALTPRGKMLGVAEFLTRLRAEGRRLVAVVGADRPPGLDAPAFDVAWIQPDSLPEDWRGFSSLDALVWLDGAANEVRSPAQLDAVRTWVSSGGHLVVARANEVGLARTPLAEMLPVALKGTREVDLAVAGLTSRTVILDATPRRGKVRLAHEGQPLQVEAPYDAGRVTFLAFNPARPPLAGAKGAPSFWKDLLGAAAAGEKRDTLEARMRPPHLLGSTPLAQQAGTFPNVAPPAIGGLFVIILIYLAVVGPGDYIGLRLLRRLELTWLTFPAYVVGFTALILLLGGAFMRGSGHLRETAVRDHFLDSEFSRHRAVAAVLAPSDTTYRFEDAEPVSTDFRTRSLYEDTSGDLARVSVVHGRTQEVRDWSIHRGHTGLALVDRCGKGPSPLTYAVESLDDSRVVLTVQNGSGAAYTSAMLVTPRGAYWLSHIPPGEGRLEGPRNYRTYREFADADGARLDAPEHPQHFAYDEGHDRITEDELNRQVMKTLITLCFPPPLPPTRTDGPTGIARSLDARRWVDSGGSVLLAWSQAPEDPVRFDPRPLHRTALVLTRFFKGPSP